MKEKDDTKKEEKEPKVKEVFREIIKCPHCKKRLMTYKTKKLIKPAVRAEYEEKVHIEKDLQKTLDESTKGDK